MVTKTVKSGKAKKATTPNEGAKQAPLLPPPGGKFEQKSIDGKTTIKETASKEIQEAAEYWFGKKVEEARSKDNSKRAGEKLLQLMEFEKKTSILVFNSDLQKKVRVNIIEGAEKLRIEKNVGE